MRIELDGETVVQAGRAVVWMALHDPDVLARCVPGCRSLKRLSDRDYALELGIGPLGPVYSGTLRVAESEVPRVFRLIGQGGGRAVETTGTADITLDEFAGGCRIRFTVAADVAGLPALAGRPMVRAFGRMIASTFAARLGEIVAERDAAGALPVGITRSESKV